MVPGEGRVIERHRDPAEKDVRRRFQEEPELKEVEAVNEKVREVRGGGVRRGGLLWRNRSGAPKGEGKSGTEVVGTQHRMELASKGMNGAQVA